MATEGEEVGSGMCAGVCVRCATTLDTGAETTVDFPGCAHYACQDCFDVWCVERIPSLQPTDVYSLRCFNSACDVRRRVDPETRLQTYFDFRVRVPEEVRFPFDEKYNEVAAHVERFATRKRVHGGGGDGGGKGGSVDDVQQQMHAAAIARMEERRRQRMLQTDDIIAQVVEMGFDPDTAAAAVEATQRRGAEAAVAFLLAQNEPPPPAYTDLAASALPADPDMDPATRALIAQLQAADAPPYLRGGGATAFVDADIEAPPPDYVEPPSYPGGVADSDDDDDDDDVC